MRHNNAQYGSLEHTLRRYYIDEFFSRQLSTVHGGSLVLDLGGNKIQKRGLFDIDRLNLRVIYVNLSKDKMPDVQADAVNLPFRENVFDVVVCSELLEHVYDPERVLSEVMRVLKPSGILLVTVPFLVPFHADPYDYGRSTNQYWKQVLNDVGFSHVQIEKQGYFWSVLLDMLRGYVLQLHAEEDSFMHKLLSFFLKKAVVFGRLKLISKETFPKSPENVFFGSYTTGFGILAIKP